MIEAGELQDYADAARRLGGTRARITQIVNLLNLPPAAQEEILAGEVVASERRLRSAVHAIDAPTARDHLDRP